MIRSAGMDVNRISRTVDVINLFKYTPTAFRAISRRIFPAKPDLAWPESLIPESREGSPRE